MNRTRRHLLMMLGASGVGALAGCSSSDGGGDGGTTNTPSDESKTPTPVQPPSEQSAKLAANSGDTTAGFGSAVAVSDDGTTAIIGAPLNKDSTESGASYVFEVSSGTWNQQTKLTADDGGPSDKFGSSVAVSGDGTTVIIGAPADADPNGAGAGSAYVFNLSGDSWTQTAKIAADDAGEGDSEDRFGTSVALSHDGTTAIMGAPADENPNGDFAGSAYVFDNADGNWSQQTKLSAEDGDSGDAFGSSVAISSDGSTGVVGALNDEDPNGNKSGSAYVFQSSGGAWSQQTKFATTDGNPYDRFGHSLSLSGDGTTAVIGAPIHRTEEDSEPIGASYIFTAGTNTWNQQAKLIAEDGDQEDRFGWSVNISTDGTTAVIGAPYDENPNSQRAGSGYVFEVSGDTWSQQAKIAAQDGDGNDEFGTSVAANSNIAIIGSPKDEDPNGEGSGSAYVFN